MKFVIKRKLIDFDAYVGLKMSENKADSSEKCRQLWDKEVGRKYLVNGTWKVEVEEKENIPADSGRTTETVSTVYQ